MCHVFAQWLYFIGNQSIEHIQAENLLKSNHDKYYSYMIPLSENYQRSIDGGDLTTYYEGVDTCKKKLSTLFTLFKIKRWSVSTNQ